MQRTPHNDAQKQPDHNEIIEALGAVLESDKFTAAPQMSAFLKYVVEQAASGNMTRIKAYTVAIDALGKPDSFDPQNDPVVRVLAGRLRAALASYYEANPNIDLRITMRPGSYVPSFVYRSAIESNEKTNATVANRSLNADSASFHTGSVHSEASNSSTSDNKRKSEADSSLNSAAATSSDSINQKNTPQSLSNRTESSPVNDFATHFRWLFKLPTVGIALAALGIFIGSQLTHFQAAPNTENLNARAKLETNNPVTIARERPEQVSLFVSALEQGNSLNNQLNTTLSGVFSESELLNVYRVFDSSESRQHWPEDYLVSIDVIPLPTETHISVQLIEAQTGRICHTENIVLSKNAADGLNGEELIMVTDLARQLIDENGPLFEDYKTKKSAAG